MVRKCRPEHVPQRGVVGFEVEPGGRVAFDRRAAAHPGIEEVAADRVAGDIHRRQPNDGALETAKKLNSKTTKKTAAATVNLT